MVLKQNPKIGRMANETILIQSDELYFVISPSESFSNIMIGKKKFLGNLAYSMYRKILFNDG